MTTMQNRNPKKYQNFKTYFYHKDLNLFMFPRMDFLKTFTNFFHHIGEQILRVSKKIVLGVFGNCRFYVLKYAKMRTKVLGEKSDFWLKSIKILLFEGLSAFLSDYYQREELKLNLLYKVVESPKFLARNKKKIWISHFSQNFIFDFLALLQEVALVSKLRAQKKIKPVSRPSGYVLSIST